MVVADDRATRNAWRRRLSVARLRGAVLGGQFRHRTGPALRRSARRDDVLALDPRVRRTRSVHRRAHSRQMDGRPPLLADPRPACPASPPYCSTSRSTGDCATRRRRTLALLNSTSPIFIAVLSVLLLRQRMSALALFGSLVSLAGVLVIVGRGDLETLRALRLNAGDLWILRATLSWAGVYRLPALATAGARRSRPPDARRRDQCSGARPAVVSLEMAGGRVLTPTVGVDRGHRATSASSHPCSPTSLGTTASARSVPRAPARSCT